MKNTTVVEDVDVNNQSLPTKYNFGSKHGVGSDLLDDLERLR